MSVQQPTNPEELIKQQQQAVIQDFQMNLNIAQKPSNDLARSFNNYVGITNNLLAMKDGEIQRLTAEIKSLKAKTPPVTPPTASPIEEVEAQT